MDNYCYLLGFYLGFIIIDSDQPISEPEGLRSFLIFHL